MYDKFVFYHTYDIINLNLIGIVLYLFRLGFIPDFNLFYCMIRIYYFIVEPEITNFLV